MPDYFYERLSAQDSTFLPYETPNTHMHIGWTWVFEAGPLCTPDGGIDIDRIRAYIESRLYWIPRYRQRLAFAPITNQPVWVDDDRFTLNYHVRHARLPHPGDEAQLKQLTARIMSQQLDRGRPLWEAIVVEGLDRDRFAIICKTHHCMVDGVSTVDLMTVLLSRTERALIEDAPMWAPRQAPSRADLLRETVLQRTATPFEIVRGVRDAIRELRDASEDIEQGLAAAWNNVTAGLTLAPATPLNKPIGPHRRVEWVAMDLAQAKAIKNRLGGTVNDVVLATVAGAVRRFLQRRGKNVNHLDFRVVVPVSVRSPEEQGTLGNRASAWIAPLPIDESDAKRRYAKVRHATGDLKESKQALGADLMMQVAEWAGANLMSVGVRVMNRLRPYNLIVTNIPGPQEPFYLLGSQMLEAYPQIPLFWNQGLGIALSSYLGKIYWGFNADWEVVPDLPRFVEDLVASFAELGAAAKSGPAVVAARKPQRRRARARR